jgi:hypothetical protein
MGRVTWPPLHSAVDAALNDVPARRQIQSMIVARGGEVELKRYFRDRRPTDSATFIQ